MAKYILNIGEEQLDFIMIGICSSLKDFRLTWLINTHFNFNLSKFVENNLDENKKKLSKKNQIQFQKEISKRNRFNKFPYFYYIDSDIYSEFYLIKNKFKNNYLIQELPKIDYVFLIRKNFNINVDTFLSKLKTLKNIQGAFSFNPNDFKSTYDFIFD